MSGIGVGLEFVKRESVVVTSVDQQQDSCLEPSTPTSKMNYSTDEVYQQQDVVNCTSNRTGTEIFIFPGAWALGEGLFTEADIYYKQQQKAQHGLVPSSSDVEDFGTKALRLAGSLGENLRFYLSEFPGHKAASLCKNTSSSCLTVTVDLSPANSMTPASAESKAHSRYPWFVEADSKKND
ncbi:hypothetical protein VaNZ11_003695 [Volvox africanus]|uniref:Uncharacterized protein n=1 Tax=Volvox africanus TaxID=51714 RepID=A0ABQ5RV66_9CHLO|nr:hypothetical protein VaNZ11_003695 [Volvox africanus]